MNVSFIDVSAFLYTRRHGIKVITFFSTCIFKRYGITVLNEIQKWSRIYVL